MSIPHRERLIRQALEAEASGDQERVRVLEGKIARLEISLYLRRQSQSGSRARYLSSISTPFAGRPTRKNVSAS